VWIFVSEYELPEAWRGHEDTDPTSHVAVDAVEVALAARFDKGKLKIRGYFVPGPNFWIGRADELLRSRSAEPSLDSFFKNLHPKPAVVGEATSGHELKNSRKDDEPLTEGGAARGYEEDLGRPVLPAIEPHAVAERKRTSPVVGCGGTTRPGVSRQPGDPQRLAGADRPWQ
jgi:hypothetical protein